jgi:hypothetical protein
MLPQKTIKLIQNQGSRVLTKYSLCGILNTDKQMGFITSRKDTAMTTSTKITVTETLNDLARYDSNGLKLYGTPGAHKPYWSNNASFMYDEVVATVSDFAQAAGYDDFGFEDAACKSTWKPKAKQRLASKSRCPPRGKRK